MHMALLPFLESDAAHQMSLDMKLFELSDCQHSFPIIRFYKISPPAITIGYHQREEFVLPLLEDGSLDVVRRPTGGRAVLHLGDLTYSVLGEVDGSLFGTSTLEIYHVISKGVKRGIEKLGIRIDFEQGSKSLLSPLCFHLASKYELSYEGEKVTGGALLKRNGGFLFQGSILVNSASRRYARLAGNAPGLSQIVRKELQVEKIIEAISEGFREELELEIWHGKWPDNCLDKKRLLC